MITLWCEVFFDDVPHDDSAQIIRQKLSAERYVLFAVVVDATVVGTVMGGYDGHCAWVYLLAAARHYQRQGIARA